MFWTSNYLLLNPLLKSLILRFYISYIMEDKDDVNNNKSNSNTNNSYINCPTASDPRIGHNIHFTTA